MNRPPFEEVKKFNAELWPLFREYFTNGCFTAEEARKFLESHRTPTEGDFVLFEKIPEKLKKIITEGHAYGVYDVRPGESRLYLDNDFSHWIDNSFLRICPDNEINQRIIYPQHPK